jgi:hypothetical protein
MKKNRYVFEIEENRFFTWLKKYWFIFFIPPLIYGSFAILIMRFAAIQNTLADKKFFKKAPDLLAVFTGDTGRIKFTLDKSKEYNYPKVLISGVYEKNTIESLVRTHYQEKPIPFPTGTDQQVNLLNPPLASPLDSNKIDIDYQAQNTIENVLSTLEHLRSQPELKKVLIISSDYHLYRIDQIINKLRKSHENFEISYFGIPSKFNEFRTYRLLFKEITKNVETWFFLLLWNKEGEY